MKQADWRGYGSCVTCGVVLPWKSLQAGHFISRKHYATRWNEENVQVQCVACNVYRYGEQYLFGVYLGEDKSQELLQLSREVVKFSNIDLEIKINYFKRKIDELN